MTTANQTAASADVLLQRWIRPGDSIVCPQGSGAPQTLMEAFMRQAGSFAGCRLFLGGTFSTTLVGIDAFDVELTVLGGAGGNSRLADRGQLRVLPAHVSSVPALIDQGLIGADVVLIQVSPPGPDGRHSLGVIADYVETALRRARTVIAEVNQRVPYVRGDTLVDPDRLAAVVSTDRQLLQIPTPEPDAVTRQVAAHVASLVPDGATLQIGIGSLPSAVLQALAGHRHLGIHSGAIGDDLVDLVEAGVVTNERKAIDVGVSVSGTLFGTDRLYSFAHRNPAVALRSLSHTHAPAVVVQQPRFRAINGALEVDLTGQVNAESVRGQHVGAVGGQVDFVRAAMSAPGGRAIIALPSLTSSGVSRIAPRLTDGVVTTPRSDADVVVTEHGVAELRGQPLHERARRLIAIADPSVREHLEREAVLLS
jgi:acetyl-CoA hydrolase